MPPKTKKKAKQWREVELMTPEMKERIARDLKEREEREHLKDIMF